MLHDVLPLGRAIHWDRAIALRRPLHIGGDTAAPVKAAQQGHRAPPKPHSLFQRIIPPRSRIQSATNPLNPRPSGKDAGPQGILKVTPPARAGHLPGHRLRIKWINARRQTQLLRQHRRAAIQSRTTARTRIEHLFPPSPVIVAAWGVALHGVNGAVRRLATQVFRGPLHPFSQNVAKALTPNNHL